MALRQRMVEEVAQLERQRAFAYLRPLMRPLMEVVALADDEDAAVEKG